MPAELVGPNDFPPLLAFLVFDEPQIKYRAMQHKLMNLVNTTLFEKYVDP